MLRQHRPLPVWVLGSYVNRNKENYFTDKQNSRSLTRPRVCLLSLASSASTTNQYSPWLRHTATLKGQPQAGNQVTGVAAPLLRQAHAWQPGRVGSRFSTAAESGAANSGTDCRGHFVGKSGVQDDRTNARSGGGRPANLFPSMPPISGNEAPKLRREAGERMPRSCSRTSGIPAAARSASHASRIGREVAASARAGNNPGHSGARLTAHFDQQPQPPRPTAPPCEGFSVLSSSPALSMCPGRQGRISAQRAASNSPRRAPVSNSQPHRVGRWSAVGKLSQRRGQPGKLLSRRGSGGVCARYYARPRGRDCRRGSPSASPG